MTKPYIICHMMMAVDGRIDCDMTAQLTGVDHYYATLKAIDAPTRISGRVTAQTELTTGETFRVPAGAQSSKPGFAKNQTAASYNVVLDTRGTLLWPNDAGQSQPHLIITSEQASQAYLDYLTKQQISWIVAGKTQIDLTQAMNVLGDEFRIERLAIVGGGKIDGGFLDAGLIDEISLLIGAGVDGRVHQPTVFDGRPVDRKPLPLKLKAVQSFDDGAVWLRYLAQ
ncbi:dihydrofolate reductase family protein [Levilactobacillus namurensis]|uniref:dihydrofolate reductase family protein n=1 Tax=Levilactobacillus namurensis TaxID=380393 RepID=UPI00046470F4|nr:dihydrofolate reductase family protein [Levilactobacillus namurensis]